MEGVLWKWTNYWNGWQTRWFILENGVLTYYKSQEEVNQGCRGSIKVQACEINVNAIDNTRLDLVIPGEQHIYLKAATSQERQQWLVALGSAKACVQKRTRNEPSEFKVNNNSEPNSNALKKKKSELRLYCDLLMQQVHVIKNANGDVEKMDDATRLLGATCDTFIKTLEECMELSNANVMYNVVPNHDAILPPTKKI
ncbi:pleckstrin homology domain-containing family A member 3 isoform X1 [Tribolium castaneum]|uniref:pleckstrin homology domain-containing family A member 3 isoform X1 n=1 Tax=Tribolium castaneum TaxID=7070 RepID=UPI00046C191B|nr:PREDICTED: pleckstrin homology domain-containing family A member 3 isoform X1 [Tribolium castaneum]XP_015838622.1 PREDICTED: pleckstrin homology domain-containing family A member 3 isoform X1 [Tribolium castaneum]|eukprot:XP_008198611.1 PREDICTED: pleckstrin homology domain-containing family A member 3 isoform X1 [Tribolium castaneum]